jgi:23S rRNA (uridine2552-2'-O)-methyltransferase
MKKWNDDHYTKKAKEENFAARSIYKLEEIERREKILGSASIVVDLGAAPGSWSQYVLKACPKAKVFAIDLSPLTVSHPRLEFRQEDINTVDFESWLGGEKADVVLSDMAPKTSGVAARDTALSFELASLALEVAKKHLKPGGNFVAKLFMGEDFETFRKLLRENFAKVALIRPDSTRKHSREIFFTAKGYKGL